MMILTSLTLKKSKHTLIIATRYTSLTGDETSRYQVDYDESFDNVIVVDGVPIIDKSKLERLLTKIAKEFSKKGVAVTPEKILMPWNDETGKSKGYVPTLLFMCPYYP